VIDTAGPKAPAASSRPPVADRRSLTRFAVIAVLLLLAIFALPPLMSGYYTDTMTQVAIYSIVTLGLGLLVGRVGLYSLGQLAVLMIGAWVGARLLFATSQPYILVLIEAGLVTAIIGSLITLPALRLRGLYLALITLMLAGGVAATAALILWAGYPASMVGVNGARISNLNPPSLAVVTFGIAQVGLALLLRGPLARLMRKPVAWAAVAMANLSAMTLFL